MTDHPNNIEELRADFETRQATLLPYDPTRASIVPDDLRLTESDGKPWGQVALAVFFLLLGAALVAIPILKDFEDNTVVAWIVAMGPLFLSWHLFRGVFRRTSRNPDSDPESNETK
jgi:hypothetical protein